MKRAHPTRLLLVTTAMLALASVAWGAASTSKQAPRTTVAAKTSKPRAHATKKPSAFHLASTSAVSSTAAGMRIFKDPETGEVGPPTQENIRQLALEQQGQPAVDLSHRQQINLGAGRGWVVDVHDVEDALVMQIDKNGNRVLKCVNSKDANAKQTAAKAPATPVREDR